MGVEGTGAGHQGWGGTAAWPRQERGCWGLAIGKLLAHKVRAQMVAGRNPRGLVPPCSNLRVECFL
jgi:hypothetical protein